MDDNVRQVPIEDLHFQKRSETLPAELIDRITLVHHVFRDYLSPTLEETIDNFKYDENPESEIRIWEQMASVVLALKYDHRWPEEKMKPAVTQVLGLSMGAVEANNLSETEINEIVSLWNNRQPR